MEQKTKEQMYSIKTCKASILEPLYELPHNYIIIIPSIIHLKYFKQSTANRNHCLGSCALPKLDISKFFFNGHFAAPSIHHAHRCSSPKLKNCLGFTEISFFHGWLFSTTVCLSSRGSWFNVAEQEKYVWKVNLSAFCIVKGNTWFNNSARNWNHMIPLTYSNNFEQWIEEKDLAHFALIVDITGLEFRIFGTDDTIHFFWRQEIEQKFVGSQDGTLVTPGHWRPAIMPCPP